MRSDGRPLGSSSIASALVALLGLALLAVPAGSQIHSAEPGESGIRFLANGSILSVSAREAATGLVVTVMGQDADPALLEWLQGNAPSAYDSSGLVDGVAFVPSPDGGLPMLEIDVRTRESVAFSVSNEGTAVEIRLAPQTQAPDDGPEAIGADEAADSSNEAPRRVLTASDLQPLESGPGDVADGAQSVRARTIGRVNLRSEPTLEVEPLMTLPDRTVVRVIEAGDDWWLVRLGELEGWLRGDLLESADPPAPREQGAGTVPPGTDAGRAESPEAWLGERGAWLDRLDQALGAAEAPGWDGGALRSGGEVALQDRAEREAARRRLAVAEQDLREARAESASLRIELARASQQLDEARTRKESAESRAKELEAMIDALRQEAVASRSGVEGERLRVFEVERRAEVAERERARLQDRIDVLEEELIAARVASEMARVEADGLRLATRQALNDGAAVKDEPLVLVVPDAEAPGPLESTPRSQIAMSAAQTSAAGAAVALWAGVEAALDGWSRAWSNQDPDAYFSHYAEAFFASRDAEAWRDLRRRRLREPEWIEVEIEDLELTLAAEPDDQDPIRVRATFVQTYRSSSYQDVVRKEVDWAWVSGAWKIVDERSAAVLLVGRG